MKASLCSSILLLLHLFLVVRSQQGSENAAGGHQQQQLPPLNGQPSAGQPGQVNRMNQGGNPSIIKTQDRDHIMHHLEEEIEKSETEMTQEELTLHYFRMHDYDKNNKLDGNELVQAMTHYHDDHGNDEKTISEKELEEMIDPILQNEDKNSDGYIDFLEYAKGQQV
ncbi:multiple coagulation factor deficiency protein 2 homolog [Asterias rubens]|uniref:multiple coagulation factor deficiency protein 2 homolog n=1 Tax=Asterias rubens TaxID=7604 RepID=UPI001455C567|nr:multiple coagulation factor deficiency protein 2 homolog [Asterias rubens]